MLVPLLETWSVYAINLKERVLQILDPTDATSIRNKTKEIHWKNGKIILRGLVRIINECIPTWEMDRVGWSVGFKIDLYESCAR